MAPLQVAVEIDTACITIGPFGFSGAGPVELPMIGIVIRGAEEVDHIVSGVAPFQRCHIDPAHRRLDVAGQAAVKPIWPAVEIRASRRTGKGARPALGARPVIG